MLFSNSTGDIDLLGNCFLVEGYLFLIPKSFELEMLPLL
jgi:hypothetical protein